jgi:hypothetical protein
MALVGSRAGEKIMKRILFGNSRLALIASLATLFLGAGCGKSLGSTWMKWAKLETTFTQERRFFATQNGDRQAMNLYLSGVILGSKGSLVALLAFRPPWNLSEFKAVAKSALPQKPAAPNRTMVVDKAVLLLLPPCMLGVSILIYLMIDGCIVWRKNRRILKWANRCSSRHRAFLFNQTSDKIALNLNARKNHE